MTIKFYTTKGEHGYMSNFYRAKIDTPVGTFPTTEHYYQAHKALTLEEFHEIMKAPTPKEAARLGRSLLKIRPNWEVIKYGVMLNALMFKFTQHPELAKKLLATWPDILEEDTVGTPRPDGVWGTGVNGEGLNALGSLLMTVRSILRHKHGG